jgi:hypothetical protein
MSVAIPKKIFEKALSLKISHIELNFSGGSDEGILHVCFTFRDVHKHDNRSYFASLTNDERAAIHSFESEVEEWAYDAYCYSGAGDGSDYGDDYVYDLANKTISHSEWYTARQNGGEDESEFEIEDENE